MCLDNLIVSVIISLSWMPEAGRSAGSLQGAHSVPAGACLGKVVPKPGLQASPRLLLAEQSWAGVNETGLSFHFHLLEIIHLPV